MKNPFQVISRLLFCLIAGVLIDAYIPEVTYYVNQGVSSMIHLAEVGNWLNNLNQVIVPHIESCLLVAAVYAAIKALIKRA